MKNFLQVCSLLLSMLLFSSCSILGGNSRYRLLVSQEQMEAERTDQIISAIQNKDQKSLYDLFSPKAVADADALDEEIPAMFDYIQGEIVSWERESGTAEMSIQYGKRTQLLHYSIHIYTDQEAYSLSVFDYSVDTIYPENEGLYQIEIYKQSYSGTWKPVTERMHGGIDIVE